MNPESRVELLWNCSNELKPETHAHKLLKSYYMNMCRQFARNIQVPKEKFAPTKMCLHCGCFWHESEFKMKLKPQKVTIKSKTKKLIDKLDNAGNQHSQDALSGKQRKRAKWLKKSTTNYMEIKCRQCEHKTLIKMEKPKKTNVREESWMKAEEQVITEDQGANAKTKKKKKNKNKNKNAGLIMPATEKNIDISVKESSNKQTTPQSIVIASNKASKIISKATNKQNILPPFVASIKASAITNIAKPLQNKVKKKKANTSATPSKTKVVSQTQKQNSLLQLAALLKQQSSSSSGTDSKSSTQKRLESLLK